MNYILNKIDNLKSDLTVCYVFSDKKCDNVLEYLNNISNDLIKTAYKSGIISTNFSEITKIALNEKQKVVIIGLGKYSELTRKKFSIATANGIRCVRNLIKDSFAIETIDKFDENKGIEFNFDKNDALKIAISAINIGLYQFDKYLLHKNQYPDYIEFVVDSDNEELSYAVEVAKNTSLAMNFTKDLVFEQAQIATPDYIADLAKNIASDNNLDIKVYDKSKIKELGMNAYLAVGQGSINEPKFIHLIYKPKTTPRKKIALIGKGITFDAGGMNIKQATSMLNMKDDMTGAASVLGIIQAISKLNSDIELHVVSALCENMTSGSAYKQGDVLTAMNGKTIEVENTDAEGRITLADALCYCDTLDVDEVIDIATLTGAVVVSLGKNITGVMGNNQSQINKFIDSSKRSCEYVWQMPMFDDLIDNLKSKIADMKNTAGKNAGTSTAACFLSNFTKSKSWMHLDIAGTAFLDTSNGETLYGPTGVMIRSLINYLLS